MTPDPHPATATATATAISPSSSSSDDDDEENHTLICESNLRSPRGNSSSGPSIFEITCQSASRIGRRVTWPSKRCLLLGVCLPLGLIFLFFSIDLRRVFGLGDSFSPLPAAPTTAALDPICQNKPKIVELLKKQRSELLRQLNSTVPAGGNGSDLSPTPPPGDSIDAIKSDLKMNEETLKYILSTCHGSENISNFLADSCPKVEKLTKRRTIEWKPRKDRFLFAICLSGQMSNHLICLEKHMFFAALLNRILVLPSSKFDYQYEKVLDIKHINKCFGLTVVISFEEFEQEKKNKIHINKFLCYMASPPCFLDEEHKKRLKNLGLQFGGNIEAVWPEDSKLKEPKKRFESDILTKFQSDEETIAIGDMFYADVEEEWLKQQGGPLAHTCGAVIQPHRLIALTAERFVQTDLGRDFVAVHFRRHGYLKFCNAKKEKCFFPTPQAANCIKKIAEKAKVSTIFLSTDATESRIKVLRDQLFVNGITIVERSEHNPRDKWDSLLYRNHIGGDTQVEAMLDKTICSLSKVFIGTSGSTFTDDIMRLRKDWGVASKCDEYLCQGEEPNFVMHDENQEFD